MNTRKRESGLYVEPYQGGFDLRALWQLLRTRVTMKSPFASSSSTAFGLVVFEIVEVRDDFSVQDVCVYAELDLLPLIEGLHRKHYALYTVMFKFKLLFSLECKK